MIRLALIALFLFTVPSGAREGREANALYEEALMAEAADRYRLGLERADTSTGAVPAGLLNNLGCALYEQQEFAEAQMAFEAALRAAIDPEDRARAAYNAGNAHAQQQNFEAALGFYRRALLARPDFYEAAFNYEYLKRQLQDGAPQESEPNDLQPSPFAEEVKAEADALVADRRYGAALEAMQRGLAQDSTVGAYQEFMGRLGAVVEIDESAPDAATLRL